MQPSAGPTYQPLTSQQRPPKASSLPTMSLGGALGRLHAPGHLPTANQRGTWWAAPGTSDNSYGWDSELSAQLCGCSAGSLPCQDVLFSAKSRVCPQSCKDARNTGTLGSQQDSPTAGASNDRSVCSPLSSFPSKATIVKCSLACRGHGSTQKQAGGLKGN